MNVNTILYCINYKILSYGTTRNDKEEESKKGDKDMTREEAKELLPVIQAFAEGKVIEFFDNVKGWIEMENPAFKLPPELYRIKKYRPFKNQEECWEEMHKYPDFGWVKNKNAKDYCNITDIYKIRSGPAKISINNCEYTLNEVFNSFTFTDGTPFGIKEE